MREVPVQGIAIGRAGALEQRHQAEAIECRSRPRFDAGDLQQRGVEIGADGRRVADAAGLRDAGPEENGWLAEAALVDHALATSQRLVGRDVHVGCPGDGHPDNPPVFRGDGLGGDGVRAFLIAPASGDSQQPTVVGREDDDGAFR